LETTTKIRKEGFSMKRIAIFLGLAPFCLAAAGYRPMLVAVERHRRHDSMLAAERNARPLILDATTKAILAGADRVETFRLADFHEREDRTPAEEEALSSGHLRTLDDHVILRTGAPQGKAFATALRAALSQAPSPVGADGLMSLVPSCFDPGVGFRVWKGAAHVDLCVCFYCSGVEIVTKDAKHKIISQQIVTLGRSRAAFLALSRQAFPQDAALAAVKDETQ